MVRPSNPRLVACVLDAVMNLGNTRGSSAREVLDFVRQSNVSSKNLTLQVQRALKNAMNAGLLRYRSGRYKALATLNPAPSPAPAAKESTNDQENEEKKLKPDVRAPVADVVPPRRRQEHKKRTTSRRRSRSRRRSTTRRKSRRSPYTKRASTTVRNRKRRQRKRTYEDEELEDQPSGRYALHERDHYAALDRRAKRSRVSNRERESDFSDESDRESDANHASVFRASTSSRREPRQKEARAKSRGRSASRACTPHLRRTPARQPIEEISSDRQQCDDEHEGIAEHRATHQEEREATKGACEPNDSNSALENS